MGVMKLLHVGIAPRMIAVACVALVLYATSRRSNKGLNKGLNKGMNKGVKGLSKSVKGLNKTVKGLKGVKILITRGKVQSIGLP